MPSFIQNIAPSRALASLRWLAAIAVLGFLAVAFAGPSARVVNAALQTQGARAVALVLLATPIVLALRSRPTRATTIE